MARVKIAFAVAVAAVLALGAYTAVVYRAGVQDGVDAHAARVAERTKDLNEQLREVEAEQRRLTEARRKAEEALNALQARLAAEAADDPDGSTLGADRVRRALSVD